jgi:hypothetical protein
LLRQTNPVKDAALIQKDNEKEMRLERVKQRALAAAEPGKVPYKEEDIEAARHRLLGMHGRNLLEAHVNGSVGETIAVHWLFAVPISIFAAMLLGFVTDSNIAFWLAMLSGPAVLFALTSREETQRAKEWREAIQKMDAKNIAANYCRFVRQSENPRLWAELAYVKRWYLRELEGGTGSD